jgi:hypothetical protein
MNSCRKALATGFQFFGGLVLEDLNGNLCSPGFARDPRRQNGATQPTSHRHAIPTKALLANHMPAMTALLRFP